MAHGLALKMEEMLRASYKNEEHKVSRYKEVDMNSEIPRSADEEVLLIIKSWRDMINNPKKNRTDFFSLIRRTLLITFSKNWMIAKSSLKTQLLESLAVCKVSFVEKVDRCDEICRSVIAVAVSPWRNVFFDWKEFFGGRLTYEDKKVQNFIESEIEEVLIARAHSLLLSGCYDMAMDLVKCLFKYYSRIATGPFCKIKRTKSESNVPICKNPKDRRGFSTMEWYIFLLKRKGAREIINDLKEFSCHEGIEIVNRLRKDEQTKSSAYSAIQVFIIKDLINPSDYCCTKRLYIIWCEMLKDLEQQKVTQIVQKILAGYAPSSAHFYLFGDALWDQFGAKFLSLHTELYIRGLTSDINHLEVMRNSDLPGDMESLENHIASMFDKLSTLYSNSHEEVARECMFSAFSLRPTEQRLYVLQSLTHSLLSRDNHAQKDSPTSLNSHVSNSCSKNECSCGFRCSGTCKSISKSSDVFHPLLTRGIKNVKYYLVRDLVCVLECVRCVNFQYNVFDWNKNATELGDYLNVHIQSQHISRRPYNWGSDSETEFASDYSSYENNEMAVDEHKSDNSSVQITDNISPISLKRKNKSDFNNEMFSLDVGANIEVESDDSANKKLKTGRELTDNMDESESQKSFVTYNKPALSLTLEKNLSLFEATTKLSSNEMVHPFSLTNFAKAEHCKTDLNSFSTIKSRTQSPINLKSSFIRETIQPTVTSENYFNKIQNQDDVSVSSPVQTHSQNNSSNSSIVLNKNLQADLLAESSRVKPITLPFSNAVINKRNSDALLNNYKLNNLYNQEALNLTAEQVKPPNVCNSQKAEVKKVGAISVSRPKVMPLVANVSTNALTITKAISHQLSASMPNSVSNSLAPKQSRGFVIPKIKHPSKDPTLNVAIETGAPSSASYNSTPKQSQQLNIQNTGRPSLNSSPSAALGTGTPVSCNIAPKKYQQFNILRTGHPSSNSMPSSGLRSGTPSSASKQAPQYNVQLMGHPSSNSMPSTGLRTGTPGFASCSSTPKIQQYNNQKTGQPSSNSMPSTCLGAGTLNSALYSSTPKQGQQYNIQETGQPALDSTPSLGTETGVQNVSRGKSVSSNSLIAEMLRRNSKMPTSKPDGSILKQSAISDRNSVIVQHTTQIQNTTTNQNLSIMPKNSHLQGLPVSFDKNMVQLHNLKSFPSTPGRYKVVSVPIPTNYSRKQSSPQNLVMSHNVQSSQSNSSTRTNSELSIANSQSSDSSAISGNPASSSISKYASSSVSKYASQPVSLVINKKSTWSSHVKPHGHVEYTKSSVEKSQLDGTRIYQMANISVTQGNSNNQSAISNYQVVYSAKSCAPDKRMHVPSLEKSNVVMMTQGNTNQHATISASKITNPNFVADLSKTFNTYQRNNNQKKLPTILQQGTTFHKQTISASVSNPRQNIFIQNFERNNSNSRSNEMTSHANVINQPSASITKVMSNPTVVLDHQKSFGHNYERHNSNATITTHGNIPNEVVYSTGISDARNNISNQKTFCVPNVEKSSNSGLEMGMPKSNQAWYSAPFPKQMGHPVAQDSCDVSAFTNQVSNLESRNSPTLKSSFAASEPSLQTVPTFNNNVIYLNNQSSSKGLHKNSTASPVLKNILISNTPDLLSDVRRSSPLGNLQSKPSPSFSNPQLQAQQNTHLTSLPIQNTYSIIKPGNFTTAELVDVYTQLNQSISSGHAKLLDSRKQPNQNRVILSQMASQGPVSPSCRIKACCSPMETNPCDNCSASETNRSVLLPKGSVPDHKALPGSYPHPNSMVYNAIEDRNSQNSHTQENHDYELFHTPRKEDKQWHCQFCEKTLPSPSSLQLHLTTFHSLETLNENEQNAQKHRTFVTTDNFTDVNQSTTNFKSSLASISSKKQAGNTKGKSGSDNVSKNLNKSFEEDNLNNIEDNVFKMCMDLIDNDHDLNQIVKDVQGLDDAIESCPLPLESYASNPTYNSSFIDIVQKVELPSDFLRSLTGDNEGNFLNRTAQHRKTTNESLKENEPKASEVSTVFTGIFDFINTEQKFQNFIQEFDADDTPVSFDEKVSTDEASESEINSSYHSSTTANFLGSPSVLVEEKLPDSQKLNEKSNIKKKNANILSSRSKKALFPKNCSLCNESYSSALEYDAHMKNIHSLLTSEKRSNSDVFDFSDDSDQADKSALPLQNIKKNKCVVKSASNCSDSLIPNNQSQNSNNPILNVKSLSSAESEKVQSNFTFTKRTASSDGKIKKKCEHCGRMLTPLYMKRHIKKMHSESLENKSAEKNYTAVKIKSEFSPPSIVAESKNCHTTFSVLHEQDIDSSTCLSMSDALKANTSFELTNTNQAESVAGMDNAQTKSNLGFCFEVPESRNKGNFFSIRKQKCIDPKILDLSPTSSKHLVNSKRLINSRGKQIKAKCVDPRALDLSPTSINNKRMANSKGQPSKAKCTDSSILDLSPTSSKHLINNSKSLANSKNKQSKAKCTDSFILDLSPKSTKHLISTKPLANSKNLLQKRKPSSLTPKELTCDICNKTLSSPGNLTRHKKRTHKMYDFKPVKKSKTNKGKSLQNTQHNMSQDYIQGNNNASSLENKSPLEKNAENILYSIQEISNSIVSGNCSVKQEIDVGAINVDNSAQKRIDLTNHTTSVEQKRGFCVVNSDNSVQKDIDGNLSVQQELSIVATSNCGALESNLCHQEHKNSIKDHNSSSQTFGVAAKQEENSSEEIKLKIPDSTVEFIDRENYFNIRLQINKDFQNNLHNGNSSNSGELSAKPIDCRVNFDSEHLTCSNVFHDAVSSHALFEYHYKSPKERQNVPRTETFVEEIKITNNKNEFLPNSLIAKEHLRSEDSDYKNRRNKIIEEHQSVVQHSSFQVVSDKLSLLDAEQIKEKSTSENVNKEPDSIQFHIEMEQNLNRETVIKSSKCLNLNPCRDLRTSSFEKNNLKGDLESDENYIDDVFIENNQLSLKRTAAEMCGNAKEINCDEYILEEQKDGSLKERNELIIQNECEDSHGFTNVNLQENLGELYAEKGNEQLDLHKEINERDSNECHMQESNRKLLCTMSEESNKHQDLEKFNAQYRTELNVEQESMETVVIVTATEINAQENLKEIKKLEKSVSTGEINIEKCFNMNRTKAEEIPENFNQEKCTLNIMHETDENILSEKPLNSMQETDENILSEKSLNSIQETDETILPENFMVNSMQERDENVVSEKCAESVIEEKCDIDKNNDKFNKNILLKKDETGKENSKQEGEKPEEKTDIDIPEGSQKEIDVPETQKAREGIDIQEENVMRSENNLPENETAKTIQEESGTKEIDIEIHECNVRVDKNDAQEKDEEKNLLKGDNNKADIMEEKDKERSLKEEHKASNTQERSNIYSNVQVENTESVQKEVNDKISYMQVSSNKESDMQDANNSQSYQQENNEKNAQVKDEECNIGERSVQEKEKSDIENKNESDVNKDGDSKMQDKDASDTYENSECGINERNEKNRMKENNEKSISEENDQNIKTEKSYIVENDEHKENIILKEEVESQETVVQKDLNILVQENYKQKNFEQDAPHEKVLENLCRRNVEEKDVEKEYNVHKIYLEGCEKPLLSKLQGKHLQSTLQKEHADVSVQKKYPKSYVPKSSKSYIRKKYEVNDIQDEEMDFDKIIEEINAQRKANIQGKIKKISLYKKSNFCAQRKLNKNKCSERCINVLDSNESKQETNISMHEAHLETVIQTQKQENITQVILEETIKAFDGIDDLNITSHFHNKQRTMASNLGTTAIINSIENDAISQCGSSSAENSVQNSSSQGIELFSAQELFSPQESNQQLEVVNNKDLKASTSSSENIPSFSKLGECPKCHEVFGSIGDLNIHMKTIHLLNNVYGEGNNAALHQRTISDNFIDQISESLKISNFDGCKQDSVKELLKEDIIFEPNLIFSPAQTGMNIEMQTKDQKNTKGRESPKKLSYSAECIGSSKSKTNSELIKNNEISSVQEKNQRKNVMHLEKSICDSNLHLKGSKPSNLLQKRHPLSKKRSLSLDAPSIIKSNVKGFRCKFCRTMIFSADSFKKHMTINHAFYNTKRHNTGCVTKEDSKLRLLCKNDKSAASSSCSIPPPVEKSSDTDSTSSSPNDSLQAILPVPRIKKLGSSDKDSSQDTQDFPAISVLNGKKMPRSDRFRLDFVEARRKRVKSFSNRIRKKRIRNIKFSDNDKPLVVQCDDGKISHLSFSPLNPITREQCEESCKTSSNSEPKDKVDASYLNRCEAVYVSDAHTSKSVNTLQQDHSALPGNPLFEGESKILVPLKNCNFNKRLRGKSGSVALSVRNISSVVETFKTPEEISRFLENRKQPIPQLKRCDGHLNNDQKILLDQMRQSSAQDVVDSFPCHGMDSIISHPKEPLIVRVRKSDTSPSPETNTELNSCINEIFLSSTQSNKNAYPELIIKGKLYTIKNCSISLEKLSCEPSVP